MLYPTELRGQRGDQRDNLPQSRVREKYERTRDLGVVGSESVVDCSVPVIQCVMLTNQCHVLLLHGVHMVKSLARVDALDLCGEPRGGSFTVLFAGGAIAAVVFK